MSLFLRMLTFFLWISVVTSTEHQHLSDDEDFFESGSGSLCDPYILTTDDCQVRCNVTDEFDLCQRECDLETCREKFKVCMEKHGTTQRCPELSATLPVEDEPESLKDGKTLYWWLIGIATAMMVFAVILGIIFIRFKVGRRKKNESQPIVDQANVYTTNLTQNDGTSQVYTPLSAENNTYSMPVSKTQGAVIKPNAIPNLHTPKNGVYCPTPDVKQENENTYETI